ncbi:MAG: purS [Solirubrobacterales bacterium]|nr:purS [Solirubrobacterales bacterium]
MKYIGRVPRVRVLIRPKEGILDPQGKAVARALPALGFPAVDNVHVGRLVELDVEDVSQVEAMCERLLANTLIEDYEVALVSPDGEHQSQTAGPDAPRR